MDEEEQGEGLNDLRKKRLAYYETLNLSNNEPLNQSTRNGNIADILSMHESNNRAQNHSTTDCSTTNSPEYNNVEIHKDISENQVFHDTKHIMGWKESAHENVKTENTEYDHFIDNRQSEIERIRVPISFTDVNTGLNVPLNAFRDKERSGPFYQLETQEDLTLTQDTDLKVENKHVVAPDQVPLKTSSFYVTSPEDESHGKSKKVPSAYMSNSGQNTDGLDGYNETVERLIRATKEEILGIKVSDDIWTNFSSDKRENGHVETTEKRNVIYEEIKMQSDFSAQNTLDNTQAKNVKMGLMRSFSESNSQEIAQQLDKRGSDHEVKHREHRSSFSNSYDSRPMYSKAEPVKKLHHVPEEIKKSVNSAKIEEMFSSRHISRSQLPKNGCTQESREFEPVREIVSESVNKSEDFSALGLSTHRPDSERTESVKVEAEDINLGDTVTKELRILLGEDKFNQFVMKAKRDIDDLHQSSNENSARKDKTPRLLKDKPTNVCKSIATPKEFKEDQPKSILKCRETVQKIETTSNDQVRIHRSLCESKELQSSIRDSSDFTPRQTDAEAVENLIGEYVLTKQQPEANTSETMTSNPVYKSKKNSEDKTEVEDNIKVSVPALDLGSVTKNESPRPKLNRPKHEPPSIYQDKHDKESDKDKLVDRDIKPSTNKNYEQFTVPRNVAFSVDEIYNQAYGVSYPGQGHTVSSKCNDGHVAQGQYGHTQGSTYHAPLTPTTPVTSTSFVQSLSHTAQPSSQGVFDFSREFSHYKEITHPQPYTMDRPPIPHPPNQQGPPRNMPYSTVYASTPDFRGYSLNNVPRFPAPEMAMNDQTFLVPHPPPTTVPFSQSISQPNVSVPMPYQPNMTIGYPYQYPVVLDQNLAAHSAVIQMYPGYIPGSDGSQMPKPHPPTSVGAQLYQQGLVVPPPPGQLKEQRPSEPPPTPTTSNAEVQTDREDNTVNEKVTLVEESTFTAVSQIVDDEKFVPHPPATRKEGGPSPRRPHHKLDMATRKTDNSKRHVDGIRLHHEQRRQQHEDEKMPEDQIVERQRKFAKASLDRYFSSLENIYNSSTNAKAPDQNLDVTLSDIEDAAEYRDTEDLTVQRNDVIDDVMSTIPNDTIAREYEESAKTETNFHPVVHGFIDFTEADDFVNTKKKSEDRIFKEGIEKQVHLLEEKNEENDKETLVDSNVNTDLTLKGGGLTERLNDLGIDVTHLKHTETSDKEKVDDRRREEKKGKILIVCPECQGLNKEYMSWCTYCGEMIIGVEPMLVSKNREGKIRMKPLEKEEMSVQEDARDGNIYDIEKKVAPNPHEVNYVQELDIEKPFTLNLEGIKTDKDEKEENPELFENKKVSPIKSDGKDSGRPSSDDPDLDLQTQKIEEEVVNDICASISDPVLKGYVRSHFNKSKHSLHDSEGQANEKHFHNNIQNLAENMYESRIFSQHDVVNITCDSKNNSTKAFGKAELLKRHNSDEQYHPDKYETRLDEKVNEKIPLFTQKHSVDDKYTDKYDYGNLTDSDQEVEGLFVPPPLPNFSSTLPVPHNELALKLPANSMDYSTDMSQVVSHNYENYHEVNEKGDNVNTNDEETFEEKELKRAQRKKDKRRKRGHGAIDVEVFGYEESRESRNSSRANRMVPLLNLGGNSSDEDDSVHSDFKPIKVDAKEKVKQKSGSILQVKQSVSAWEPTVSHEDILEGEESSLLQQPMREEEIVIDESSELWRQPDKTLDGELKKFDTEFKPGTKPENDITHEVRSPEFSSPDFVEEMPPRQEIETKQLDPIEPAEIEDWKHLFDPNVEIEMDQDPEEGLEDETEQGDQPFLMQIINQPKAQKTKKKPKSARGKPVKSKVRQSLEEPGYQRRWARSSTAWSSFNQGELNTSSSLRLSSEFKRTRPASAPKSRSYGKPEIQASMSYDDRASANRDVSGSSSAGGLPKKNRRPVSAPKSRVGSNNLQTSLDTEEVEQGPIGARGISPTRNISKIVRPVLIEQSNMHGNKTQALFDTYENEFGDTEQRETSPVRGMPGKPNRPSSVPHAQSENSNLLASVVDNDHGDIEVLDDLLTEQDMDEAPVVGSTSGKKTRPYSADLQKRKVPKKKNKKSGNLGDSFDLELSLVSKMVEHRLPKPSAIDRLSEHMASPRSTYDKYIEMTPRIQAGTVSRWQCLPDEILLHVFSYLDQSSLPKCAQVCQQYYRVAMDESLWKYITIKKSDVDDNRLEEIARRHPVSLALVQCHGELVTAKGLRDLFRQCAESIKELNISRCSGGALTGDSLLLHAAARCHNLTHVDASWCSLTDSGLMAISNSCHRLESLCINGCNAVSNDGLETVIKKHGQHLRVLEMFGCFNLSPRGLRSVANNCVNLLTLNIGQCYKLTDSCISQLSTSLGRVESLDLRGCKQIKDNCMRRVVKNCSRLKHLSLANCPSITDVSVLEISTYLTDIRSLDLCGCKNISDGSIRALVNTCTNLRHIDISSTGCTHRSVSMIANFSGQRLETLKINFLSDVTEQSLIKLAKHCRRLKSVHMYGCPSVRNLDKVKEERPTFAVEM